MIPIRPLRPTHPFRPVTKAQRQYGLSFIDQDAVRELELYANNESSIYPMRKAIAANLRQKIARGKYDSNKALKAWLRWVTEAARKYIRESGGSMATSFPLAVRRVVAERQAKRFESTKEV